MKKTGHIFFLTILMIIGLLSLALGAWHMKASSVLHLWTNPSGDATACTQHPSSITCTQQVSPFGTGQPGTASCATHASLSALVALSDPTQDEAPLATLQVWQSPTCHATFASASTSLVLGLQRTSLLTVSIAQRGWWQSALRETSIRKSGGNQILHAWTSLLYSDNPTPEPVEACVSVVVAKTYHVCTTTVTFQQP